MRVHTVYMHLTSRRSVTCVYVCMCVHVCVHCVCLITAGMYVCMNMCAQTCVCTAYMHMSSRMSVHVCLCVHVCSRVCIVRVPEQAPIHHGPRSLRTANGPPLPSLQTMSQPSRGDPVHCSLAAGRISSPHPTSSLGRLPPAGGFTGPAQGSARKPLVPGRSKGPGLPWESDLGWRFP